VLNIAGYPGDKAAGTLWFDSHRVARTGPTKVHYDIDTAGGQDGATVYLIDDDRRIAVAIHAYGGASTNSGTRISPPVFRNLTAWKL
jgi:glutamyl endopeptidase